MVIETFYEIFFYGVDEMQFTVIGGDKRFEILKRLLISEGHTISLDSHIIILPLPLTRDGVTLNAPLDPETINLSDIIDIADEGDIFFGGLVPPDFTSKINAAGALIFDYNKRDSFAELNAIPTAEGALMIAIEATDFSLYDAECLISGYGKIGKVLANYLKALGAKVTVSARKKADLEYAEKCGINHILTDQIGDYVDKFSIIFNTVPHRIFTPETINMIKSDALYIELASSPYGADFDMLAAAEIRYINAPSLPARVAPVTASKNILNTINEIIREEFL